MSIRGIALIIAIITSMAAVRASVPIIVSSGVGKRVAMSFSNKAEKQLEKGDVVDAKHNVDAALHADPKYWPALFQRAEIFAMQGKPDLAIKDCNEALRLYPTFVDAALLRATINALFGKYAEALKEINYVISLHPARVNLGRALKQRAWLQATCPNPVFRNGQQAIKDAKAACSISEWRDEDTIDTLAAAYAETGDFASATRYAARALTIKNITPRDAKRIQQHLTLFQQNRPVRL